MAKKRVAATGYIALMDDLEKKKKDQECTDIVTMESHSNGLTFDPKNLPGWAKLANPRCGKCLTELPEDTSGDGRLPVGWVATGASKQALKRGKCNCLCVRISRAGMKMNAFTELSPLEVSDFFKMAVALSGKKLKEEIHPRCQKLGLWNRLQIYSGRRFLHGNSTSLSL